MNEQPITKEEALDQAQVIAQSLGERLAHVRDYGCPQGAFRDYMQRIWKLMYYIEKAELP